MPFDLSQLADPVRLVLGDAESGERAMPLAPSSPIEGVALTRLRSMTTASLFAGEDVVSKQDAECVRSGLYLYLSALDESHTISQNISSSSGSYWHGIMHRQEPDYSNAKYWFHRVGRHPIFEELAVQTGTDWDPFEFIDRCRAAELDHDELIALQRLEWQTLFSYCYRKAVGR
jgi:hypothetical protein